MTEVKCFALTLPFPGLGFRYFARCVGMSDARAAELPPALNAQEWSLDLDGAGRLLCYRDDGGAGVPVLLLHSINAAPSALEVAPLFDHFRGQRPVIAPDLPGFGRSNREERSYTPEFYSAAIRALIAAYCKESGAAQLHVVALSTTSEFVTRAAIEGAANVASLTLVSPTGMSQRLPPTPRTSDRVLSVLRFPGVGGPLFRLLRTRPSIRFFLRQSFAGDVPPALVEYGCRTTAQPGAQLAPFHFLSGKLFTRDASSLLYGKLELPTLVIYDTDPHVSFERLPSLLEANSNIRAQRVTGSRGLPHYDQPEATFSALDEFWRTVES